MIIGLFVIGIGLLFLLDNLGWLDLDFTLHILPTVLIGAGILKLQTRTAGGAIVGGGLILFGGVILLQEMGIIQRLAHAVAAADDSGRAVGRVQIGTGSPCSKMAHQSGQG
jgi:hypothetical protein